MTREPFETFSTISNAVRAARAALGSDSQVGVNIAIDKVDNRFAWRAITPEDRERIAAMGKEAADGVSAMYAREAAKEKVAVKPRGKVKIPSAEAKKQRAAERLERERVRKEQLATAKAAKFSARDAAKAAKALGVKPKAKKEKVPVKRAAKVAKAPAVKKEKAGTRPDGLREGSAMAKMVDAVCRKSGSTYAHLLEVTGWKQCRTTLAEACKRAGVKLEFVKDGEGPGTYFGTRP